MHGKGKGARHFRARFVCIGGLVLGTLLTGNATLQAQSVAHDWNEQLLAAIRRDFARPTVHARNLWHTSIAMYDAWAVYDLHAFTYLTHEYHTAADVEAAREESISYAMYRILRHRFASSPGAALSLAAFDAMMVSLSYDINITTTVGNTPAAVGNRIAANVIAFGLSDNSNEQLGYANLFYFPVNPALVVTLPGNPDLLFVNRWQPLALDFFVDQNGIVIPLGYPPALSPEWGIVKGFSLTDEDLTIYQRGGFDYWVYHDPGPPPLHGTATEDAFKQTFEKVIEYSSLLDPTDGVMLDIGPGARGNNTFGTNDGTGHPLNPFTNQPYAPNVVPAGDYYRVLAEFWADGPSSETPPGHWNFIANTVMSAPGFERRFRGQGPILDELEYEVKLYLALNSAVHDAAISAWGVKGWYDFVRPVSAIRYLCGLGQCSDPMGPSFHPGGIHLIPDLIEVVTPASSAMGERHEHLAADVGKIAIKAWRGPDFVVDPQVDTAGVDWILADNWWPYQRPTFVSPPFPGYVSGHSTFSRASAELMSLFTGSPYFPNGLGEFHCPQNAYLVFEEGPSVNVTLQWATYGDAADECSLSRIYGGIHPPADDIPGRFIGRAVGHDVFRLARAYFNGAVLPIFADCETGPGSQGVLSGQCLRSDKDGDNDIDVHDLAQMMIDAGA
ncbi:MAG: vanadium-dependent haloperoxidase [Phycisphaerae bacterium]